MSARRRAVLALVACIFAWASFTFILMRKQRNAFKKSVNSIPLNMDSRVPASIDRTMQPDDMHILNASQSIRTRSNESFYNLRQKSSTQSCVAVLRIIVLTVDRHKSLLRLLRSLENADYGGDCVDLDIWIDRAPDGSVHVGTHLLADKLWWPFGRKTVHTHKQHVGLRGICLYMDLLLIVTNCMCRYLETLRLPNAGCKTPYHVNNVL